MADTDIRSNRHARARTLLLTGVRRNQEPSTSRTKWICSRLARPHEQIESRASSDKARASAVDRYGIFTCILTATPNPRTDGRIARGVTVCHISTPHSPPQTSVRMSSCGDAKDHLVPCEPTDQRSPDDRLWRNGHRVWRYRSRLLSPAAWLCLHARLIFALCLSDQRPCSAVPPADVACRDHERWEASDTRVSHN